MFRFTINPPVFFGSVGTILMFVAIGAVVPTQAEAFWGQCRPGFSLHLAGSISWRSGSFCSAASSSHSLYGPQEEPDIDGTLRLLLRAQLR